MPPRASKCIPTSKVQVLHSKSVPQRFSIMKFVKNGPDVPDRLIEAHEEGRVVFFCGAGISYPANLPTFGGLVQAIYVALGENLNSIEKTAFIRPRSGSIRARSSCHATSICGPTREASGQKAPITLLVRDGTPSQPSYKARKL
jgi:hypothetical protein